MRSRKRKKNGNSIVRAAFVAISLMLQIGWILLMIMGLNQYSGVISLMTGIIGAVAVLRLYSRNTNSAFKIPWIMLMMALPVMGLSKLPEDASETLRIVRVGDYDDCACIGAHVGNTSEIGEFRIISHDFNDGIWRVRWKVNAKQ